jgi:hypothetical protein
VAPGGVGERFGEVIPAEPLREPLGDEAACLDRESVVAPASGL